jgi:methylphosphotriester-DNA--protein-cysteine methyltransferase
MFNIRYFAPHPRLRHLIRSYSIFDAVMPADKMVTDRLITEYANLRVLIGGTWRATTQGDGDIIAAPVTVAGPNSHPSLITGAGSFTAFAMALQPLGWTALIDAPACVAADHIVSATDLLDHDIVDQITNIISSSFNDDAKIDAVEAGIICRLQKRAARMSPVVRAMQDLIVTQPINRVDDLGLRVETSPRQLERLSKQAFGFSPKTMLRRARIRRTIEAMKGYSPVDWEVQAEQDFADQSHLIHEFRRFTGFTPATYLAQVNPLMDIGHAMQAALARKMRHPQNPDNRLKVQMMLDSEAMCVKSLAEAA